MTPALEGLLARILAARERAGGGRSVLVAMTGIDGAGKGYLSARLAGALRAEGVRVAGITIDGWLNLPARRFAAVDPAEHFYRHAIRFDEMFDRLVLPLRDRRSLRLEADLVEETATAYHRHLYDFEDVDVIVLEGIYLLKRGWQGLYDLSVWVDCSFETALARALARRQEGLSAEDTIAAYRTIYFPAQEIHLERDAPRSAATTIVSNDPRLAAVAEPTTR
jgi:uridine kinase